MSARILITSLIAAEEDGERLTTAASSISMEQIRPWPHLHSDA